MHQHYTEELEPSYDLLISVNDSSCRDEYLAIVHHTTLHILLTQIKS